MGKPITFFLIFSVIWLTPIYPAVADPSSRAFFCSKKTEYDHLFQRYADDYLNGNWLLLKSISCAESNVDNDAVSQVGAKTLMQIMDGTWRDIAVKFGWDKHQAKTADRAIKAGAYYYAYLRKSWRAPRPDIDRSKLASASYNAGIGNVIAAQKLCGGPALYDEIIECLPQKTGEHSAETIGYVNIIFGIYEIWSSKK